MSLYRCQQCGCVENTAFGFHAIRYWPEWPDDIRGRALCSACGPSQFKTGASTGFGKWHDRFEKKPATGYWVDQQGSLWSQGQIDAGMLPVHFRIFGKVVPATDEPAGNKVELLPVIKPAVTLAAIKLEANALKGVQRARALDMVSKRHGFRNFADAKLNAIDAVPETEKPAMKQA